MFTRCDLKMRYLARLKKSVKCTSHCPRVVLLDWGKGKTLGKKFRFSLLSSDYTNVPEVTGSSPKIHGFVWNYDNYAVIIVLS